jgi:hypothetical protein
MKRIEGLGVLDVFTSTDSSDICFISKTKTHEISKIVHHNMKCLAILGLNCGFVIDKYTIFQPCKNCVNRTEYKIW